MDCNNLKHKITAMKGLIISALITIFSIRIHAQTFDEWFRQNATQKKYLLQQIAALQIYMGYVQKGYTIAHNGLNMINDIKKGDLSLHSDYFNSLKTVTPAVRKYGKIADIIAFQFQIVNEYKSTSRELQKNKAFNSAEIKYFNTVFNRLIDDCTSTIDELTIIITNNQLEMKDDERIRRIDALYNDMQGKYSFAKSFADEAKILAVSRFREQNDIETSRALNGIKN